MPIPAGATLLGDEVASALVSRALVRSIRTAAAAKQTKPTGPDRRRMDGEQRCEPDEDGHGLAGSRKAEGGRGGQHRNDPAEEAEDE
jgi:hypothetical protein